MDDIDFRRRGGFQDAFGQMVWDHYRGHYDGNGIYRSHTGETRDGHPEWYFGTNWDEAVDQALRHVREQAGRVLDIGCGAGKHATHLQQQGTEVIGGDPSPLAIRTARERGLVDGAVMDLRAIPIQEGALDVILVLGTQLGVGETISGLKYCLKEFRRVTGQEGRIVADMSHPGRYVAEVEAGERVDETTYADLSAGIAGRRMRTEYRDLIGPWIDLLMLTPAAFRETVASTIWNVTDLIDHGGRDYIVILDHDGGDD